MKRIIRIGKSSETGNIFCEIEYTDGNLSISGVEGPWTSGNCKGGCGQIVMHMDKQYFEGMKFAPGWNKKLAFEFVGIWNTWHLNDMRAGCKHQRKNKWEEKRIDPEELPTSSAKRDANGIMAILVTHSEHPKGLLSKPCPACGYKYGSAWLKEEVPPEVISFLEALPSTDIKPAWV